MSYFFRDLHLNECQLDELWTFVYKKEDQLDPIEQLLSVYGDAWVWIAFSPVFKLVPAWLVGKRTLRDARKLVFRLKSATDGHIPFFTSDELPHYADALLDVYGELQQPPRQGSRGPLPAPRKYPPPDLCYAVVVKERERGRVVNVTTRIVYGTEEQIRTALHDSPVSQRDQYLWRRTEQSNRPPTFATDGTQGQRVFQRPGFLGISTDLGVCLLSFRDPASRFASTVAQAIPTKGPHATYKKWKQVTPAMAAGLTDHIWTMDELLSFRVPPKCLW